MRVAPVLLLLAIGVVLLLSYVPTSDYIDVAANRARIQPTALPNLQQRAWQSRWARVAQHEPARAVPALSASLPPPPPPPPERGQSAEARAAVQEALRQQIPKKGDGRRGGFDDQTNVKRESDTVRNMLRADGLERWRPDPALLPPQAPAGASMEQLLRHVPVNGTAWLAFGNAGVTEMLMNWVYWMLRLGLGKSMVVAAYDEELLADLRLRRIPAYNYTGALPSIHFRGTPFLFHRMGFLKARTIREVLLTGRHVLVSDSDVVWLRDPTAELLALAAAGANLAPATDCINVAADRDKTERKAAPYLCGHSPGSVHTSAVFNTGIIFLASSAATVAFCETWAATTLHLPSHMWWSDDQGVFNQLITGGGMPGGGTGFYPVRSAGLGGRLIRGPRGLVIAPLAAERFCSGHLVWMQQDAQPRDCHAVHATFTEFGDAGKRWRFLEAGLWGPLPPDYYTEGRYLTFEPPKPPDDPAPCKDGEGRYRAGGAPPQPCGGEDPLHRLPRPKRPGDIPAEEAAQRSVRLRHNVELMRRQLHALRDALALAYVLNRTLVLPHFDCLCDRSELVEYVPSCVFPGAPADLPFPRKCSTHFVLNIHKLLYISHPAAHGLSHVDGIPTRPIPLRTHAFLRDERARLAIGASSASIRVVGPPKALEAHPRCSSPHDRTCMAIAPSQSEREQSAAASDARSATATGSDGGADGVGGAQTLTLRRGASNEDVRRVLEAPGVREARLLRLSDAEGAFGGWVSQREEGHAFNRMEQYFLLGGDWCCSSRRANDGRLYPVDPPVLPVAAARRAYF